MGQTGVIPGRMDNGLVQPQASEVVTHIAFYAGWANAFSALPVVNFSSDSSHIPLFSSLHTAALS